MNPLGAHFPPFPPHALAPRSWPTWLLVALLWMLTQLPHRWRRALGRHFGAQILARNAKRQAIMATNLEWCLPELTAEHTAIRAAHLRSSGQLLFDLGLIWWLKPHRLLAEIEFRGAEHLHTLRQQRRPIIAITGHQLAVDWGGLPLSAAYPASAYFAKPIRNQILNWLLMRGRSRFGARLITRDESLRPLIRDLRSGALEIVYMVIDEDLGAEPSVVAPFFGIPKMTLATPIRLARLTGAALLPCSAWFDSETERYVVQLEPPLTVALEEETAAATVINQCLETMIRRHPEHYLWSLRYFNNRPDGSPPPYIRKGNPAAGPRPRPDSPVT